MKFSGQEMKVLVVLCTVMIWKLEALCSEKGHFLNGFGECVKCPDHCQSCNTHRYCSTCEDGYWGNTCELPCSKCYPETSCEKSNGFCLDKCKDGYTGLLCDAVCDQKCFSCDRMNAGLCDKCAPGLYGETCDKRCSSSCYNISCDPSGNCIHGCQNGYWGNICEHSCPTNCKDNSCYWQNGTCIFRCDENYTETTCINKQGQGDGDETFGPQGSIIALLIVGAVLILVAGTGGIVIWRKKIYSLIRLCNNRKQQDLPSDDSTLAKGLVQPDEKKMLETLKVDYETETSPFLNNDTGADVTSTQVLLQTDKQMLEIQDSDYEVAPSMSVQYNTADITLAKVLVQPEEKKTLKTLEVDNETETSPFLNKGTGFAADRFHMAPSDIQALNVPSKPDAPESQLTLVPMAKSRDGKNSKSGKMVVAAIDFGTTYSGYALSFAPDFAREPAKVFVGSIWDKQCSPTLKTPTVLLLDNNKRFVAFGYEAEDTYSNLAEQNIHQSYYYFRRFKIPLYSAGQLKRDMMIPDDNGRQMKAIEVLSIAITYLKKHLLDTRNKQMMELPDDEILWVLTVPAIWSDGSKQFMRGAAEMAGIKTKDLMIAFEPEAASLYYMHLPVDKLMTYGMTDSQKVAPFAIGTKYMVVDVGGATTDITVYEVVGDGKLKEISRASAGACGGTMVDAAFENFLRSIVGDKVFDKFAQESKEGWIELFREFETKKRSIKVSNKTQERSIVNMKLPFRLSEILGEVTGKNLEEVIKNNKSVTEKVTYRGDKLRIDTEICKSWFDESCTNTVNQVKKTIQKESSVGTNTILLAGGFSESPILQDAIRKNFPDKRLIMSEEAGLAVLKGAVMYGHDPVTIVSRIAKCSVASEQRYNSLESPK